MLLLLVVAGVGYFLYSEYQKVQALRDLKIYLVDVRVVTVGLTSATLELKLRVHNPTSVPVSIDRVAYTLYGDGNYVADGGITEKTDIPAGGERLMTSRLEVSYSGLAKTVYEVITRGGGLAWRVKGVIYSTTLLGTHTVSFEIKM